MVDEDHDLSGGLSVLGEAVLGQVFEQGTERLATPPGQRQPVDLAVERGGTRAAG